MRFEMPDTCWLVNRLEKPKGPVDVVLDTDTYNEIDDQFALSYLLLSGDRARTLAIYAAPFHNDKSTGPEDGMEKSYDEIMRLLSLMGLKERYSGVVHRGSTRYLPDEDTPVESAAARDLVRRAMERGDDDAPLYVVAIGAITNVASALLMEPAIARKIVVVWLGGHALHWHNCAEFNLKQDVAAARVIFGSGVPVVQVPCMGVANVFAATGPELSHWLGGKNALCDYLVDITYREAAHYKTGECWSRVLWDVTAVAWLTGDFTTERIIPSSLPAYSCHYESAPYRHPIRYVYHVNRDRLMDDLCKKLTGFQQA